MKKTRTKQCYPQVDNKNEKSKIIIEDKPAQVAVIPTNDSSRLVAKIDKPKDPVKTNAGNDYILQVAMNSNNVEYINIANTSVNKNKLRGLFRKVSRVLEKTTNADDNNKHSLAIGNIHVSL